MTQEVNLPMDKVWCEEVIISTVARRGEGKVPSDPIRIITQVFTKDGKFIAEYDSLQHYQSNKQLK